MNVILALGSNQGERVFLLNRACQMMEKRGVRIAGRSKLYYTRPMRTPASSSAQPCYVNAVIRGDASLAPLDLLNLLQTIEREMGRVRGERWGPRVIDIDIILYDNVMLDHPRLRIPHPDWRERDFVLAPILDLPILAPMPPQLADRASLLRDLNRVERHIESSMAWP